MKQAMLAFDSMRLAENEINAIREVIKKLDPDSEIFLFGSRTDSSKKGGDIDLLVESGVLTRNDKRTLLAQLKERLGEQKIDVVLTTDRNHGSDPFIQSILKQLVKL